MDRTDFTGKSIIVTGASTGIGRAITYQMAAAGARVFGSKYLQLVYYYF